MDKYDIGLSSSTSSSASNALNSAFNVNGGGGSAAVSAGEHAALSGVGTPTGSASWLPYGLAAVVVVAAIALVSAFLRK